MEKIIILGAGIYQVPLIKKVKEKGYEAIVVSISGDYPGFSYADKVYHIDTTNEEAVLEIAKKEKIKGILTTGTDVAVATVGRVCDTLGLCGINYSAAKLCTNKCLMKNAFEACGVRGARHLEISFNEDVEEVVLAHFTFPIMYKAVDSSGSRGIIKVTCKSEMELALSKVKKVTKKDYFIVEEFIEGYEIGVEAFVANGEVLFVAPHGKYVFHGDADVPLGHCFPFEASSSLLNDIEEEIKKAIFALKLNNCAVNADVMVKDDQAYVIEVGGRAGATCLPELISLFYDIDYYELMIKNCIGDEVNIDVKPNCAAACKLLIGDRDGNIKRQLIEGELGESTVSFDYNIHDYVRKFHIGPDRIGHMIATASTVECVELKLASLRKQVKIEIE